MNGKLHALLSTARVANVPSVALNVWLGIVLGSLAGTEPVSWMRSSVLISAGICLYLGGNFLNDWRDREWDRVHRPERALPRGLFRAGSYLVAAVCLIVGGVAFAAIEAAGWAAAGIAAGIVIYTVWHKDHAWAVIPLGFCRALLPVMGAAGTTGWKLVLLPAAGLFFYIVSISLCAREESITPAVQPRRGLGWTIFAAALMISATWRIFPWSWWVPLGSLPLLGWLTLCRTHFHQPIHARVSAMLAGIPFVDGIILLPLGLTLWDARIGWISVLAPPAAFVLARGLQRIAPAT